MTQQTGALEIIGEIMKHFEVGIQNLKNSVCYFEKFKERFAALDSSNDSAPLNESEISIGMVKQKAFIDEFFDASNGREILPKDFKQYDLKNNAYNEKFLTDLF